MGTVVCPTLDRVVRESLSETEQKNSSSEEQSSGHFWERGGGRGWKNKPQIKEVSSSKCLPKLLINTK